MVSTRINRQRPQLGGILILTYTFGGEQEQQIDLVWQQSNLGRGGIWYALCPVSRRRCRCLYFWNGQFVSRYIEGLRYSSQRCAKSDRAFHRQLTVLKRKQQHVRLVEWATRPHSRRIHKGKPTRSMSKLIKIIAK